MINLMSSEMTLMMNNTSTLKQSMEPLIYLTVLVSSAVYMYMQADRERTKGLGI